MSRVRILRKLRPRGLRSLVLLMIIFVGVAASIAARWNIQARRAEDVRQAHREVLGLADLVALNQREIIDSTRQFLTTVARIPGVQASKEPEKLASCIAAVRPLLAANSYRYSNVGLADVNGDVRCSALPSAGVVNMGDRPWFQRAIGTRDFQVGTFQTGRISRRKVLVAGHPVLDSAGRISHVLFAELPVETIVRFISEVDLPPNSEISVIDKSGTLLMHSPVNENLIGISVRDDPLMLTILDRDRGTVDLDGLDGVRRINAFTPLGNLNQTEAYVVIGSSRDEALAQSDQANRRALATAGVSLLLLTFFVWFVIDRWITRRLRSLTRAAQTMAAGDFPARSGGPYSKDELGDLAMAFDTMAAALEVRRREADEHRQALQRLADQLSVIHEIDGGVLQSRTLSEIAGVALDHLQTFVPADCLGLALVELGSQDATLLGLRGRKHPPLPIGVPLPVASLGCLQVGQTEGFAYIGDLALALDDHPELRPLLDEGFRSVASFPLATGNRMDGLLTMAATEVDAFSDADLGIATEVSTSLTLALTNTALHNEIRDHALDLEKRVDERTAELATANVELEAFTYSASHDLQAPLRALRGFAKALLEDHAHQLGAQGKEFVRRIDLAARQMDKLLQDLLSYSVLGRTESPAQAVSLDAVVQLARESLQADVRQSGATITVASPLGRVYGQEVILVPVVMNLLSNALKFVPAGDRPRITVRSTPRGAYMRLCITDEGIGVPVEHRSKIFRILERLHSTEEYPGTGIGLAIVEKGARRMGGIVGVEDGDTGGSTFWVELPASPEEPA